MKQTRLLTLRAHSRPRFVRRGVHDKKKLSSSWRMPKGAHNKMRRQLKAKGALSTPGYGSPAAVRGLHPSGFREVRVFRAASLEGLDPALDAIRIAAGVGMRSRIRIQEKALKQGLRVLNPRAVEKKTAEEEPEEPATETTEETTEATEDE